MSALSREIGSRGRADAVVAATADTPEPCPESNEPEESTAVRSELEPMRLMALQKRATSDGVPTDDLEAAMDSDDPKASLIDLIVEAASTRGPADRLLSALRVGGETAADALATVLDHAMDVLEQLSVSSPRKSRKAVRTLLESVEELSEGVDDDWCDGLARCKPDLLETLASRATAVRGLRADQESDNVSFVSSLLDAIRECGSVAAQCESVVSVESEESVRLSSLECVRRLPLGHLETMDASEASLFDVLQGHLCGKHLSLSCAEQLSCWLSLFALGCRNGVAVLATVDVFEPMVAEINASVTLLGAAISSGSFDDELRVCAAAHLCAWGLVGYEAIVKCDPEKRAPLEESLAMMVKTYVGCAAKSLTDESFAKLIARVVGLKLLEQKKTEEDVSLACGAANTINNITSAYTQPYAECDAEALFGGALKLLRNAYPSPLPSEWWVSTCAEVDVTSVRLALAVQFHGKAVLLDQTVLDSASWLGPVLNEAAQFCKVNASAGLSARPTFSSTLFSGAFRVVEMAAKVSSHVPPLLESGVVEALDYACANGFEFLGTTTSSGAAGAAVALVGRNEGGKTLSGSTVNAVLDTFAEHFDPTHFMYAFPLKRASVSAQRIAIVAVSDANKKIMLQHDAILDSLVNGLLLDDDNPRRGQDGADAMQEVCAGVLHELALYGPGATVLRENKPTMDALRVLAESGTKESRERAAGALFELDEEARAAKAKAPDADAKAGSSKPPPHVMVSYNWDHQHVILRVVAWLQTHGYLVWVDTEQMKGSTVDAMALAVEGSEVMLIGVSRPYKESSNCRMEAQYGLQKKKAMIPLMMQEGYEADGWLGLLLGTSLWYALYGATLEAEPAFEDRMSALSREIGSRGRADAVVAASCQAEEPSPEPSEPDESTVLRSELEGLRLRALERRALSEGLSADVVDDAMDGEDPKTLLIALIVETAASRGPADRLVNTLTMGGEQAAEALSTVLDHAMDVLEQVSVSSPRKSRKSLLELMGSVEEVADIVDDAWCDGASRCGSARLGDLATRMLAVQGLRSGEAAADCIAIVSSLLDSLRGCGSVVVQCESVLAVDAGSNESERLSALECVRGLSPASLGAAYKSEASLFGVLTNHLRSGSTLSCKERLACLVSAFVLGCRNGVSVVARVDVLESLMAAMDMSIASLGAAVASGSIDDALCACSAAHLCAFGLVSWEAGAKSPLDIRAPVEKRMMVLVKPYMGGVAKAFSVESFGKVVAEVADELLEKDGEDALGCGALNAISGIANLFPRALAESNIGGLFGGAFTLLRRVSPSPLPAEWWVSTCAEVDVTSVQLAVWMQFCASAKQLDRAALESASWLGPGLAEAVHICKVNASAGLSARPTMSWCAVSNALSLVETAARVESHAASLPESGVLDALDYACVNDFNYGGKSVSSEAAGAVVSLVGRNEGGKTLSRSTVATILDGFAEFDDPTSWKYSSPVARMMFIVRRVATVAIADANKKLMLQHDKLLGSLVTGLLLDDDSPRRGQDGADALQEACAGVLHELALYGPGAAALQQHKPTMDALRVLVDKGTKESRERAAGALFELDEETRAAKTKTAMASDADPGSSKPPPHIMVSYNWDHQHVILRVVAWLQAHGYLVWVDTEQMKGSTVDAMALAVE
eukprot:COSAG04_NODE_2035_length_4958_cov_31.505454_1_plen_1643_part_10